MAMAKGKGLMPWPWPSVRQPTLALIHNLDLNPNSGSGEAIPYVEDADTDSCSPNHAGVDSDEAARLLPQHMVLMSILTLTVLPTDPTSRRTVMMRRTMNVKVGLMGH